MLHNKHFPTYISSTWRSVDFVLTLQILRVNFLVWLSTWNITLGWNGSKDSYWIIWWLRKPLVFWFFSRLMERDQASSVKCVKSHFHFSMLCIVPLSQIFSKPLPFSWFISHSRGKKLHLTPLPRLTPLSTFTPKVCEELAKNTWIEQKHIPIAVWNCFEHFKLC